MSGSSKHQEISEWKYEIFALPKIFGGRIFLIFLFIFSFWKFPALGCKGDFLAVFQQSFGSHKAVLGCKIFIQIQVCNFSHLGSCFSILWKPLLTLMYIQHTSGGSRWRWLRNRLGKVEPLANFEFLVLLHIRKRGLQGFHTSLPVHEKSVWYHK